MKLEIRNGKVVIDGYVNAVERFSKPLYDTRGKFIEKIMPSAFQRAIEKNDNILVLLNHDYNKELANTKNGTAKLYEDNIGLRAIVEIEDETVISKAKSGKLRGWSFGFHSNKEDRKKNDDGFEERTVRDLDLIEVSIIDDRKVPAYYGTSIEMRGDNEALIEYRGGEFDQMELEKEPDFKTLTISQKREMISASLKQQYSDGWLEDFDDSYIYAIIDESYVIYKMPYSIIDNSIVIDFNNQVKVIRGGYTEVRADNSQPEQHPEKEVEKIDYSYYEERLRKIKEEK